MLVFTREPHLSLGVLGIKKKLSGGGPSLPPFLPLSLPQDMCFPKICTGFVLMWIWFMLAPV